MGIEWFRDLSITILGFVASAVLIFTAILVYRLYRTIQSTLLFVKAASKIVFNTLSLVQEGPLVALIRGIRQVFESFTKKLRKENSQGEGNSNH